MQQLQTATNHVRTAPRTRKPDDAARAVQLLDFIPRMMCRLRNDVRAERGDLTVSQFRILARVSREPETASSLAENQGVSLSAMSRMVDTLARKGYLTRQAVASDRRRVLLHPTARGRSRFLAIQRLTQGRLADRIRLLPLASQRALADGLAVLGRLFP
jgi:DNA-binding MarR family transcriptional regulator